MKIVSFCCNRFLITFFCITLPLSTQLILTCTDLVWKVRIDEKRAEWKREKEAAKKEKEATKKEEEEQKRAREMKLQQEIKDGRKRSRKQATHFTVEDRRLELLKKRKV